MVMLVGVICWYRGRYSHHVPTFDEAGTKSRDLVLDSEQVPIDNDQTSSKVTQITSKPQR